MKRILLTGMSGTGKSTTIVRLAALGCKAVDLDSDEYSEWVEVDDTTSLTPAPGKDWLWRADQVQNLLLTEDSDLLIVSASYEIDTNAEINKVIASLPGIIKKA